MNYLTDLSRWRTENTGGGRTHKMTHIRTNKSTYCNLWSVDATGAFRPLGLCYWVYLIWMRPCLWTLVNCCRGDRWWCRWLFHDRVRLSSRLRHSGRKSYARPVQRCWPLCLYTLLQVHVKMVSQFSSHRWSAELLHAGVCTRLFGDLWLVGRALCPAEATSGFFQWISCGGGMSRGT